MLRLTLVITGTLWLTAMSACESIPELLSAAPRPSANLKHVRLDALTLDGASLSFDIDIANPYAVELPLMDLAYGLASGEHRFLDGRAELEGTIPARGSRLVTLPAEVRFADLLAAVRGVRPGAVVPYAADLDLAVDAPGLGRTSLPLRHEGELPVPTAPRVGIDRFEWGAVTLDEASATVHLRITNENSFPFELNALEYALALADREVAATRLEQGVSFDGGSAHVVSIPLSISPRSLGLAMFNLLRGEEADYRIDGLLSGYSPYGQIDLPFESSGVAPFVR